MCSCVGEEEEEGMEVWEEAAKEEVTGMMMKMRTEEKKRGVEEKKYQCSWYHVKMWCWVNIQIREKKKIIIEKMYLQRGDKRVYITKRKTH